MVGTLGMPCFGRQWSKAGQRQSLGLSDGGILPRGTFGHIVRLYVGHYMADVTLLHSKVPARFVGADIRANKKLVRISSRKKRTGSENKLLHQYRREDALAQGAVNLSHGIIRRKLMWTSWVSQAGTTCLTQGTWGMGSIDSPTHTQEDCVKGGLGTEVVCKIHCVVAVRLLAGHQASYIKEKRKVYADHRPCALTTSLLVES
eukprot:1139726-Pelagomonas_calceolata.AAC.2